MSDVVEFTVGTVVALLAIVAVGALAGAAGVGVDWLLACHRAGRVIPFGQWIRGEDT